MVWKPTPTLTGGGYKRRDYIVSRTRDGDKEGRKNGSNIAQHAKQGGVAYQKGLKRWANPYEAGSAREWTFGWERAHMKGKEKACKGCEQCESGTLVTPPTYGEWLRRWNLGRALKWRHWDMA